MRSEDSICDLSDHNDVQDDSKLSVVTRGKVAAIHLTEIDVKKSEGKDEEKGKVRSTIMKAITKAMVVRMKPAI